MISILRCFWAYVKMGSSKFIWIFLFSLGFCVLIRLIQMEKKNIFFRIMFSIACSFIFVMTLFGRTKGNHGVISKPFESYLRAFSGNNAEQQLQIIMNIVMYIPFGAFLPRCFRNLEKCRYVISIAVICSSSIEIIQRLFNIGLLEVDDIINNVLGATIGVLLYKLTIKIQDIFMNIRTK